MESLLNNNIFLLYIITMLYVAITGVKMTERKRISLIYIFSFTLTIVGSVPAAYTITGSAIILFIYLEIMCDDYMKIKLFCSVKYKILDFLYRIVIEYAYQYFVISIALLGIPALFGYIIINYILSGLFILISIFSLASQKYLTKNITDIISKIENKELINEMVISKNTKEILPILTSMEDATFFTRGDRQHTIPLKYVANKGFGYIKKYRLKYVLRMIGGVFNRGYGTLEMQLIRLIGIELGYDTHRYRRKIFEILFSNIILNSYRDYLIRQGVDCSLYREFIVLKYIENAPIKLNGRKFYPGNVSSLLRLFDRETIEKITKEEFFVWCLGLPQWQKVGSTVLSFYSDIAEKYDIDLEIVYRELDRLSTLPEATT